MPCLHFFHTECIDKWLCNSRLCPICKFDIKRNYNAVFLEPNKNNNQLDTEEEFYPDFQENIQEDF